MEKPGITVRELRDLDAPIAFPLIHQLREHLSLAEFERRWEIQGRTGYSLHGAFDTTQRLLGVVGMRPVTTLARGYHLHVDDLVVDVAHRSAGIGKVLMGFAESWAADHDCESVFLDGRRGVEPFYAGLGYEPHTATLMRKRIVPNRAK